jgi:quinol monooxygenase YgiN
MGIEYQEDPITLAQAHRSNAGRRTRGTMAPCTRPLLPSGEMNTHNIRVLVSLRIAAGRLDEFRTIAAEMSRGCRAEPATVAYEWFLSPDNTRCRTYEAYESSAGLLAHFNGTVARSLVPKLLECTTLERLEIYGDISAEAAALVAGFGAAVFPTLKPP